MTIFINKRNIVYFELNDDKSIQVKTVNDNIYINSKKSDDFINQYNDEKKQWIIIKQF